MYVFVFVFTIHMYLLKYLWLSIICCSYEITVKQDS